MLRVPTIAALSLAVIATLGCARATPNPEPAQPETRAARRSNNLVTEEELKQSTARNALEAVQFLRPDWLRGRGVASMRAATPPEVVVYLDNARLGSPQTLTQFAVTSIKELRFYSATEATNRWGTGHSGGVIVVTTR
jgi:hypothetical protein